MDFHHLKYFVEIVSCQSYTKAAEQLFVTQPTLSKAIHQLEEEFGTCLINRSGRKFELTETGKIMYENARSMLEMYESLTQTFDDIKNVKKGEVSFSAPAHLLHTYFADIISGFYMEHENIHLNIHEEPINGSAEALFHDRIDFAILSDNNLTDTIQSDLLMTDVYQVLLRKDHYFSNMGYLTMKDLKYLPIITCGQYDKFHQSLIDFCENQQFVPKIICQTSVSEIINKMIMQGNFVAVLPSKMIQPCWYSELAVIPLRPAIEWNLRIAWKKGKYMSYASECLLAYIKQYFGKIMLPAK